MAKITETQLKPFDNVIKTVHGQKREAFEPTAWWNEEDPVQLAFAVHSYVANLEKQQTYLNMRRLRNSSLYTGHCVTDWNTSKNSMSRDAAFRDPRLTFNVVRSCVDTVSNKIGKSKPKPQFLTADGDFETQEQAKLLTTYVEGAFEQAKVYTNSQRSFRDMLIHGNGCLSLFVDEDRVTSEWVPLHEIFVDEDEGRYGSPMEMHRRKFRFKSELLAMFPDRAKEISDAKVVSPSAGHEFGGSKQVEVIESWHLRSSKESSDGRHCITIANTVLFDEPWEFDWIPLHFMTWSESHLGGFFGTGLAEELDASQTQIDELEAIISEAITRMCTPYWFVDAGSNVKPSHFNGRPGAQIVYTGRAPQPIAPPSLSSDVFNRLELIKRQAYEITGISQLSAQAKKPAGLDSGVAIREYSDIESERFVVVGQRLEQFYMDVAEHFVELSRKLYEANPKLAVRVNLGDHMAKIKWKDVDLDADSYIMQCFPVSALPSTPSGRLQMVQDMVKAGLIKDNVKALSLLNFPDTKDAFSLETSTIDNIRMMLTSITRHGRYIGPEKFTDLKLARQMALSTYLRGVTNELSEGKCDMLRTFIDQCTQLIAEEPKEAPTQEPPAPALPPTSPLPPAV